jgi:hypothetical protein
LSCFVVESGRHEVGLIHLGEVWYYLTDVVLVAERKGEICGEINCSGIGRGSEGKVPASSTTIDSKLVFKSKDLFLRNPSNREGVVMITSGKSRSMVAWVASSASTPKSAMVILQYAARLWNTSATCEHSSRVGSNTAQRTPRFASGDYNQVNSHKFRCHFIKKKK